MSYLLNAQKTAYVVKKN